MESTEGTKFSLEDFIYRNRIAVAILLAGVALLGAGILASRQFVSEDKIQVLEATTEGQEALPEIVVELSGEVVAPGVYKFSQGARIDDALISAGGLAAGADRLWVEKNLNRAAKLSDGSKIYIPAVSQQTQTSSASSVAGVQTVSSPQGSGLVNINSSSQSELEELPGIGPVYAQSIIEHRPYSTVEEMLSKGALRKSTYEKVKDLVAVY
jgi:competence protein ComEA